MERAKTAIRETRQQRRPSAEQPRLLGFLVPVLSRRDRTTIERHREPIRKRSQWFAIGWTCFSAIR